MLVVFKTVRAASLPAAAATHTNAPMAHHSSLAHAAQYALRPDSALAGSLQEHFEHPPPEDTLPLATSLPDSNLQGLAPRIIMWSRCKRCLKVPAAPRKLSNVHLTYFAPLLSHACTRCLRPTLASLRTLSTCHSGASSTLASATTVPRVGVRSARIRPLMTTSATLPSRRNEPSTLPFSRYRIVSPLALAFLCAPTQPHIYRTAVAQVADDLAAVVSFTPQPSEPYRLAVETFVHYDMVSRSEHK